MLHRPAAWLFLLAALALIVAGMRGYSAAQPANFDRLAEPDRKVFGERFKKEVWPLLARGGKDGCVGCHNGKVVSALKFAGDPDKDFRMLLRDGFFLKDDPGSLLSRIEDTNLKRRMPPKDLPTWTETERKMLEALVNAIDAKQTPK